MRLFLALPTSNGYKIFLRKDRKGDLKDRTGGLLVQNKQTNLTKYNYPCLENYGISLDLKRHRVEVRFKILEKKRF